jgi:hypothetical protein
MSESQPEFFYAGHLQVSRVCLGSEPVADLDVTIPDGNCFVDFEALNRPDGMIQPPAEDFILMC